VTWLICKRRGTRFDALDRPVPQLETLSNASLGGGDSEEEEASDLGTSNKVGKFF
jgi:hypothetical protein